MNKYNKMDSVVLRDIQSEVERAVRKFPTWPTDPIHAAAVLAEESGEVQKAALQAVYEPHKSGPSHVRAEVVQTAAMCLRFLASFDADEYEWTPGKQHTQNDEFRGGCKPSSGTSCSASDGGGK